jgi:AcrR family transcriptional regulator
LTLPFDEYRLPRGRHGIPPDLVRANQRWRLLGACAEALAARGYSATTVGAVTELAAVAKPHFYRQFATLSACVLETYELAAANALAVLEDACGDGPGSQVLQAALGALLEYLAAEPALAQVLTDPALDDLPAVAEARAGFVATCVELLASARRNHRPRGAAAEGSCAHLSRGLQGWIHLRLGGEDPEQLASFTPEVSRILAS